MPVDLREILPHHRIAAGDRHIQALGRRPVGHRRLLRPPCPAPPRRRGLRRLVAQVAGAHRSGQRRVSSSVAAIDPARCPQAEGLRPARILQAGKPDSSRLARLQQASVPSAPPQTRAHAPAPIRSPPSNAAASPAAAAPSVRPSASRDYRNSPVSFTGNTLLACAASPETGTSRRSSPIRRASHFPLHPIGRRLVHAALILTHRRNVHRVENARKRFHRVPGRSCFGVRRQARHDTAFVPRRHSVEKGSATGSGPDRSLENPDNTEIVPPGRNADGAKAIGRLPRHFRSRLDGQEDAGGVGTPDAGAHGFHHAVRVVFAAFTSSRSGESASHDSRSSDRDRR